MSFAKFTAEVLFVVFSMFIFGVIIGMGGQDPNFGADSYVKVSKSWIP